MNANQYLKKGLLRCRPVRELLNEDMLTSLNHKMVLGEQPAKELRIVLNKLDVENYVASGIKRTSTVAGFEKSPNRIESTKRSKRKTNKYTDFILNSEESSDINYDIRIEKTDKSSSSDAWSSSEFKSRNRRKRKSKRTRKSSSSHFTDCSDADETYCPSKDKSLQSVRFDRHSCNSLSNEQSRRSTRRNSPKKRKGAKISNIRINTDDFEHEYLTKIEIDENNVDISYNCSSSLDKKYKEEANETVEKACNSRYSSPRYRKKRKIEFLEDSDSSVASDGEGEEVDIIEARKSSKKIWHNNYGYIISRTLPNGHLYLRCYRSNCKGTAFYKNGRVYTGNQTHEHSRRQDIEVRERDEYRAELYKVTHERLSASTREIYELVGAKFPNVAKNTPFPQMNNLIRRWKRHIESHDNISSLSQLSDSIQCFDSQSSTGFFFSGKVVSSRGHIAIILGSKQMIKAAYTCSKLMYIDVNLRVNCGIYYIGQILTTFCITHGKILPMCYVLMENNSEDLYESVFDHIKSILAPSVDPTFIICDYEQNLRNVLTKMYSKSHLHGHFFHYAQRIYQSASNLNLIHVAEGEIANNVDSESKEINEIDKIIMQYYSLALLPEESVKAGLEYLMRVQPISFSKLSDYVNHQWINQIGIQHFAVYKQTYRANDVLDVYYRKINDILKNCMGSIKIYDGLERHHEFIKKQCTTLTQGERANQSLSKQDKLFHPFLKDAWDNFQTKILTVPQFMNSSIEFLRELHHIFKYWHIDNPTEMELVNIISVPFVSPENKEFVIMNDLKNPKPVSRGSQNAVRSYAKISPNREIRYRNANVFRHDGYAYNRQNVREKDGVIVKYMACRATNCNGTLILKNDIITPGKNGHNHPREEIHNSERIMIFKQQLRALVKMHRTKASTEIYKIAAKNNPEGAKIYSPRLAIQAMGRWKRELRSCVVADVPDTLSSLENLLLSEEGKQLFSVDSYGVNYYSGTVKTTTGQCAVVFGDTQWIVDNFKASQNWIIDSNYRGASKEPFVHHILVVFSLSKEHALPIAYILMENRSEDLYTAVFSHIKKKLAPGIYPAFIMCDYDEMIHNSIKDVYNEATLQGSLFHYAQAIYRKASTLKIIPQSSSNLCIHRTLLKYYALALLPSDLIESGLEVLHLNQQQDQNQESGFIALHRYMKSHWLERVGTAHMSTFMQCYRASNVLELFHRVFNDKLSGPEPPIFELLELIQKLQNISKSDCNLLHKNKRQYLDRIGQRFDRLIDFKISSLWKKLSNRKISVEAFLNAALSALESLHYVYNTWDLHDENLDIKAPLMIEDSFILQTDEVIRAAVLCIETDDVKNTMIESSVETFEQNYDERLNVTKDGDVKDPDIFNDKINIIKRIKPKGRVMPKRSLNAIWQDGYSYYGNKVCPKTENTPEKRYLQCRVKGCRGTAILIDGEFQLGKMEHNHKRDLNKEQTEEFKKIIKDMVFTQPLTNREIYDLAATLNPATASLVSFQSLESRLRRWRNLRYIPIMPTKLSDMDRILTDAQGVNLVHSRNGSLYSGTVTVDSGSCAVVLCESYFVKQFMSSTNMYVERNSRCAPGDVKVNSIVVIMFVVGFQIVPVAYILMEDDSEELYYAVFKYFKEKLVQNLNPSYIMCDYDKKLHNVFSRIFCDANIQGCFFHYAQALYRKAYSIGLIEDSELHENSSILKQYYALALLPVESMANGLQYLYLIQSKGFMELWKYVKTEWFEQVGSEHLSVYKQPLRCNVVQEHFHKRHNGILTEAHPGIIHLIVHLKKTHDITTSEYGTRLKQRPAQIIRKSKQLFHGNLNLLWNQHISPSTPVDNFMNAAEKIMSDVHYVFHTWDRDEHVGDITVPCMRNCEFVQNPDNVINTNRLFKKDRENERSNDVTDCEQSEEEIDDPNLSISKKGKTPIARYSEILWKDGYGFHSVKKSRENAAGHLVTYIRCKTANCRVRGSVANDRWSLSTDLHNHSKDIHAEDDATFRLTLKQMVRDQPLPLDEIYNLVASLYPESAERTPMKKIRPIMIRWKRAFVSQLTTNLVSSLIDMDQVLIGDSGSRLVETAKGSIYSGNVTTSTGHCALVFAEHNFIQEAFLGSTTLYIDTNYRCIPKDPYVDHVLIFFSICRNYVLPFAYVLMSSNTEDLLLAVLKYVKETLAPIIIPEYVICDYDITLHNVIRQVYNSAYIHGCFHHFAQSIYRKAHSSGIIDCIQTDNEHYFTLMQYYALPLLPKDDIETAFHHLSLIQPPEFKTLWLYVREQWLNRVGVIHLSVYGQPYRTNASFEVFSRKLNDMSKEANPNIYDLIAHLLKIHQQVQSDYDQLRRGRHAQRISRPMDRLFHADLRRVWRRLGNGRISAINFMQMVVEYMSNTHFVFNSWDVSYSRGKCEMEAELPYMMDMPFVAHWCVGGIGDSRTKAIKQIEHTSELFEHKDYVSGEENCDDFDKNGNESCDEIIDPMARFDSDPSAPKVIVEQQEQVVAHIPIATTDVVTIEKKLCLLCNAQNRTHACIPCGHLTYCGNCVSTVSRRMDVDKKCPICQAQYMVVLEIHF